MVWLFLEQKTSISGLILDTSGPFCKEKGDWLVFFWPKDPHSGFEKILYASACCRLWWGILRVFFFRSNQGTNIQCESLAWVVKKNQNELSFLNSFRSSELFEYHPFPYNRPNKGPIMTGGPIIVRLWKCYLPRGCSPLKQPEGPLWRGRLRERGGNFMPAPKNPLCTPVTSVANVAWAHSCVRFSCDIFCDIFLRRTTMNCPLLITTRTAMLLCLLLTSLRLVDWCH